jgi:hypothetical protein
MVKIGIINKIFSSILYNYIITSMVENYSIFRIEGTLFTILASNTLSIYYLW